MNEYAVIFREELTAFAWKSEKKNQNTEFFGLSWGIFGFCAVNSLSSRNNAKQILEESSWVINKQYIDKIVV